MDKIYQNVSESSKKLYLHNLKKLNDNKEPTTLKFLNETNKVFEKLNVLKENTRKTYLIAIIKALKDSGTKSNLKLYQVYYPELEKLNKKYQDTTKMTGGEQTNWIQDEEIDELNESFEKFVSLIKNKRKLNEKETETLLEYVVFSLYTKTIPRRGLDYVKMKTANPIDGDKEFNYYWKGKFYFNNYKTKGTYGTQVIDVPSELESVIKLYLKFKPKEIDFLLVKNNKPFVSTTYTTNILKKIFDKQVGVSMLRKYYATKYLSKGKKELAEVAEKMGNSSATLSNHYIKEE